MIRQLFSSRAALRTGLVWIGEAWIAAPIAKGGGRAVTTGVTGRLGAPFEDEWCRRSFLRSFLKATRDIVRCRNL